ncbi:MAG: UDP-N-acetylglucosamine 2-epimerase (non-hydrolyzing) [Acidobacteria bacterium]|nr:UDP-N-acetylglucosamine 2-epimerase (non-hydrolyzing) [Acidobacteriota bacterium]
MQRFKIVSVIGTRPEAIKMMPVVKALQQRHELFQHVLVSTAQHREMLDQVLQVFGVTPDIDLQLMQPNQSLGSFASKSLGQLFELFGELQPQVILIQGDTTTVTMAGLAAFYQGIAVGHVEAGLRTFDIHNPFPEEMNRKIAGCVATLHFAPTELSRRNLMREGVPVENIFVTGNTVVDALKMLPLPARFEDDALHALELESKRLMLVTAHRRENHGEPLRNICQALQQIARRFDDIKIIFPVHLNPNVRALVHRELQGIANVHLVEPAGYNDLRKLIESSYLILTDSGGIQEEAPSFNKPVLILRETTERPEIIQCGAGRLVGTNTDRIVEEVTRLLTDSYAYTAMTMVENPFGDGQAADRIALVLQEYCNGQLQTGRLPVAVSHSIAQWLGSSVLSGD